MLEASFQLGHMTTVWLLLQLFSELLPLDRGCFHLLSHAAALLMFSFLSASTAFLASYNSYNPATS